MPVSIQACFHGSTGFVSTAASAIKWQAVPFLFTPLEPPPSHSERPAQLGAYPREMTTAFFFSFVTRLKQGSHKVQSCGLQKTLLLPVSDSLSFRAKTAIPSFSTFFFFWVWREEAVIWAIGERLWPMLPNRERAIWQKDLKHDRFLTLALSLPLCLSVSLFLSCYSP